MNQLNDLARNAYLSAKNRGFYQPDDENIVSTLMHASSEIGEAFKALLGHNNSDISDFELPNVFFQKVFEMSIKDTFQDELADTIIIILSLCGYLDIDIEKHIDLKMLYNKVRND